MSTRQRNNVNKKKNRIDVDQAERHTEKRHRIKYEFKIETRKKKHNQVRMDPERKRKDIPGSRHATTPVKRTEMASIRQIQLAIAARAALRIPNRAGHTCASSAPIIQQGDVSGTEYTKRQRRSTVSEKHVKTCVF